MFYTKNATIIFEDNQRVLQLVKNAKYHRRSKHIKIHYLFCRKRVIAGDADVHYCRTSDVLADIISKVVPYSCQTNLKLGIIDTLSYQILLKGSC